MLNKEQNTLLEQQVTLLTGQLAQNTEEVDTIMVQNSRLCAEVTELEKPLQHSYLKIDVPGALYPREILQMPLSVNDSDEFRKFLTDA